MNSFRSLPAAVISAVTHTSGLSVLAATFLSVLMLAANSASKPMVTPNPDGTFTVQKEPRNGNSNDAKGKSGLVIPPQVVTPIFSTPRNSKISRAWAFCESAKQLDVL
jgi:hypothetical protein